MASNSATMSKQLKKKELSRVEQKKLLREEFKKLMKEVKEVTNWDFADIFEKIGMQSMKGRNIMYDLSSPVQEDVEKLRQIHTLVTDERIVNLSKEQYVEVLEEKMREKSEKDQEAARQKEENERLQKIVKVQEKLLIEQEKRLQMLEQQLKEKLNK